VGKHKPTRQKPLIRWLRWSAIGVGGFVFLMVVFQLLYPPGRLLPGVRINGYDYGGKTTWSVIGLLEKRYKDASVELRGGKKVHTATFDQAGIELLSAATSLEAGSYSLKSRLIPFSSVSHMMKRDVPVKLRIDKERVRYFAEEFERLSTVPAVNASVQITGSDVSWVAGSPSQIYPAEATYQAILRAPLTSKIALNLKPQSEPAMVSNAEAMEAHAKAKRILDTPLSVKVGDATVDVDKATLASWLDFPVTDGKLDLRIKTDLITYYVNHIQPKGYVAPRATRVVLYDGQEASRTPGSAGRGVNVEAASKQIADNITAGQGGTVNLATVTLTPGLTYERQYSDTSAGLSAFLGDEINRSGQYAIAVQELGGKGRTAHAGGNRVYVAASTYKLFVAYGVFQLTANGEMSWNDQIAGMTVDACFEAMIVHSDNECAVALGDRVGWGRIEDMMHAQGLGSTSLRGANKMTTANDLAHFLRKLEQGTLLPSGSRQTLLEYMKRQVYRNGIPAGTGMLVANKVGRFGYYVHDAGIVYSPSGTYIMVIMSTSGDWNSLTTVARDVHRFITR
jgi:beta-lactamase class A